MPIIFIKSTVSKMGNQCMSARDHPHQEPLEGSANRLSRQGQEGQRSYADGSQYDELNNEGLLISEQSPSEYEVLS